jgi:hypothetical protein
MKYFTFRNQLRKCDVSKRQLILKSVTLYVKIRKNKIYNLYILLLDTYKIKDKQVAKCKFFHSFAFIKYVIFESVKKH